MNVEIKQMKEDALECLKSHGENGFCEMWGCKSILCLIDEIERLWNGQTGDLAIATLKAELAKKDEEIAVAKEAMLKVLQKGAVFDAKGTNSTWVIQVLREALAKIEEMEK